MNRDRNFGNMIGYKQTGNRYFGESESRYPHAYDGYLIHPVRTVTIKELMGYRVTFIEILESRRHNSDQGRAFYDYLLGPGRNLSVLQETIRHGKELMVFLVNHSRCPVATPPIDTVVNLLFSNWVVENDIKSLREYFQTESVCATAKMYREYLLEMEQDKIVNPSHYTL